MPATMKNIIALAIIFSISLVDAVPYSKYGRTCNDIGCPSNEVCVIAEDPCTYSNSQCGRYPTCKKLDSGSPTCSTMNCPTGQKCRMDSGRPVCVKAQGYESTLNAQDTNSYDHGSHNSNTNPFQNANAPPAEDVFGPPAKPYPGNSGSNSGYPPYPSNSGSGSNNGYPPYPTNHGSNSQPNRNDGYPPYPTNNNRMPIPGQANYGYGYSQPGYQPPGYQPPGYQPPSQRYPGYSSPNYPNQNYYPQSNSRNHNTYYRRNGAESFTISSLMFFTTTCFALVSIFRNNSIP